MAEAEIQRIRDEGLCHCRRSTFGYEKKENRKMRANDLIVGVLAVGMLFLLYTSLGSALDQEFAVQDSIVQSYKSQ